MKNKIENIINEWDPIDLFPFAPNDEYKREIEKISELLTPDIDLEELAMKIKQIFVDSFGEDMFFRDDESILKVAENLKRLI
ncbi:DUF1871 family protein [Lactococcus lactis subsp. lactis]|uniref:DUF1871 family protein n=1 Tax=Lactococcus lactis TaxID=1358 RepID=UPI00223B3FF8|nr:DUF1871 family protein [Lactococcus lactis]MCT0015474.1 DUF1871 family protein [Lactococcus lactis subsp. lactis]